MVSSSFSVSASGLLVPSSVGSARSSSRVAGSVAAAAVPLPLSGGSRPLAALGSLVVPRAVRGAPGVLSSVVLAGPDRVVVVVGGREVVCRPSYASRAFGRPVSGEALVARLSGFVGSSVVLVAAFGYSPEQWFVGVEAA